MQGVQLGIGANLNQGNMQGLQLGIGANLNKGEVRGVQLGLFNHAKILNGLQIGLINIAETAKSAISIGLINIYKKGQYIEWGIVSSDAVYASLNFKLGLKRFYTIYTVGMHGMKPKFFVPGLGFGHIRPLREKWLFQPEVLFFTHLPMDFKNCCAKSNAQLTLGFTYLIGKKIGIRIAPSLLCTIKPMIFVKSVKSIKEEEAYPLSTGLLAPCYTSKDKQTNIKIGCSLGLSFH